MLLLPDSTPPFLPRRASEHSVCEVARQRASPWRTVDGLSCKAGVHRPKRTACGMSNRPRNVPEWTIVDFIHRGAWWRNRGPCKFAISSGQSCSRCELTGILLLNLCLLLPLMTSSINGFDSSLVNGQSLHALAQLGIRS